MSTTLGTNLVHIACAGEEVVSVFVEGHGHDSISEVERFLYSVAMMNVNINVQHSRVVL